MHNLIYLSKLFLLCAILIWAGGLIESFEVAYGYKLIIGYIVACFGVVAFGFVNELHNEVIGGDS